jgi:hypothetical protein
MAALALSCSASVAIAQNTGEVGGRRPGCLGRGPPRRDGHRQTPGVRPGRRACHGFRRTLLLPALRTGQWDITASLAGFSPHTQKGVVLEIGRTLKLEFRLGVQGLTESVSVTGNAALTKASCNLRISRTRLPGLLQLPPTADP